MNIIIQRSNTWFFGTFLMICFLFFLSAQNIDAATPADFGLQAGDVISSHTHDGDPNVYIINEHGYKRLFLNPIIYKFYGHLGGFVKVKAVAPETRDAFITTGLYRNCERNDQRVYAVELTGDDTGSFHHFNADGAVISSQDPEFFRKIFCINSNEENWYPRGGVYTSLIQVPPYARGLLTPSSYFLAGDYGVDGDVSVDDIQRAIDISMGKISPNSTEKTLTDTDSDGDIDTNDINRINDNYSDKRPYSCAELSFAVNARNYLAGDLNQDGLVSLKEALKVEHLSTNPSSVFPQRELILADANGDSEVTDEDVSKVRDNSKIIKPLSCVMLGKGIALNPPFIKVLFPNGNEKIRFEAGTSHYVSWSGGARDWKINILLIKADKTPPTIQEIALSTENDGITEWKIPSDITEGEYRMRVACQGCSSQAKGWYDDSDYPFHIYPRSSAKLPDYALANLKGTDFGISVDLCNKGDAIAEGFPLKITANGREHTFTFSDSAFMPGGECHPNAWSYTMWNMQAGQTYLVVAEANYDASKKEITDTNNVIRKVITVTPVSYNPTLTIKQLPRITLYPNSSLSLEAWYDSDGPGPSAAQNVSSQSAWASSDQRSAPFYLKPDKSGVSVSARAPGNSVLAALYNGLGAQAKITVSADETMQLNISVSSIENAEPEKGASLGLVLDSANIKVGETTSARVYYYPTFLPYIPCDTIQPDCVILSQNVTATSTLFSANTIIATLEKLSGADYVTITGHISGSSAIIALYKGLGAYKNVYVSSATDKKPDLIITDIKASPDASRDNLAIVRVTVCNQGTAAASPIEIKTERTDGIGGKHNLVGGGSLAAGSCQEYGTGGILFFEVLPRDTHQFRATVDPKNVVSELDENNNVFEKFVPYPDISSTSPPTP